MNKKLETILDEFAHTQGNQNWKEFKAEFPGEADRVIECFEKAFAAGQADHEHNTVSCEGCSEIYHDGIYDGTETEDNASSRRAEGEASEEKQKGRQEVFDEIDKKKMWTSHHEWYKQLKEKYGVK